MNTSQSTAQTAVKTSLSMPKLLLHLEGAVMFAAAIAFYIYLHASGWLFAALILAPDLSALGYLAGPRVGSVTYNTIHAMLLPALVMTLALVFHSDLGVQIALIWFAHLGIDRALGFGLKYPTTFPDTHLQHV